MLILIFLMGVIFGSVLYDTLLSSYIKGKKVLYCLMNATVYVLIFMVRGGNAVAVIYAFMASVLLIISIIDYHFYKIPVQFNYYLLILGIIYSFIDFENIMIHIAGFFCVSGFLCILFLASNGKMMGGGDVKLMATCGLILGAEKILYSFYLGCVLALIVHFIHMLLKKKGRIVAMGPYFTAGILIMILLRS